MADLTDKNFDDEVLYSKIPVMVDFWASWCVPSQMMKPLIDSLTEEFESKAKVRKINIDQNPKTRERYKINACPTIIIFKDGKEVIRKIGALSGGQLRSLIDSI
jgi:thioredoxin 1